MIAPARSNVRCSRSARDSGMKRRVASSVAIPTGTLTMKIHSHEASWVSAPPMIRPTAPPPAAIALHTPSALVRSLCSVNVVVMIDSAAGESSAPPSPCRPRPTISIVEVCARPFSSEAAENSATPATNSRLRPSRSPARPPSSRKPPKISVYALTTHCRLDGEKCRPVLDRGQRDVHHGRVEHDHELRQAGDHQDQPAVGGAGAGGGGSGGGGNAGLGMSAGRRRGRRSHQAWDVSWGVGW